MFLIVSIASCSSQTKNFTQAGDFVFDGGVKQEQKWPDYLRFDRVTWYHEFTSVFDLAVYRVDKNSPFFQWFSPEEKATIRTSSGPCYISLYYSLDSKKISTSHLKEQLRKMGAEFYSFTDFFNNLASHPKAPSYSYPLYTELGMCFKHPIDQMTIDLPGFNSVIVK